MWNIHSTPRVPTSCSSLWCPQLSQSRYHDFSCGIRFNTLHSTASKPIGSTNWHVRNNANEVLGRHLRFPLLDHPLDQQCLKLAHTWHTERSIHEYQRTGPSGRACYWGTDFLLWGRQRLCYSALVDARSFRCAWSDSGMVACRDGRLWCL